MMRRLTSSPKPSARVRSYICVSAVFLLAGSMKSLARWPNFTPSKRLRLLEASAAAMM